MSIDSNSLSVISLAPAQANDSFSDRDKSNGKFSIKAKECGITYELFKEESDSDDNSISISNINLACQDFRVKDENNDNSNENKDNENDKDADSTESLSYCKEILSMFSMSIPLSIGNFARLAMYNIDTIFLGHLGTDELAGVALCMILMEIVTTFVYSPAFSLNGICSQAIGAGNSQLAGTWLQLAIFICAIISLPALIVYHFIADIIAIFNSDDEVIHYARVFSSYAACWLLLGAINFAIRGYLQSIEVILPLTIVPIIIIICDALLNYILIYGININFYIINIDWNGFGFIGSPLATLSCVILQFLIFYIWCFKYKSYHIKKNAWPKDLNNNNKYSNLCSITSLKSTIFNINRVKAYSKIMIPNMISDATENWAYQVTVILCATLPSNNVAALACMFDFWGVLWSFYSGFGAITVTKIGKQIGNGNINKAKFYSKVSIITGSIITGILSILCFLLSNYIGQLYSNDKNVIDIMDNSLKILSCVYFIGSIGWTASNTMEAMSKNQARGVVLVITAWFIYLPLAVYLAFVVSADNCPVCMIFVTCLFVETIRTMILWSILIYKVDWKKQSMYAMIRSEINENVISKKLGFDINYVKMEINKQKNNTRDCEENMLQENKNKNKNKDGCKDKNDKNNENMEYISLHNGDLFSTSVEIVENTIIKDNNGNENKNEIELKESILNSDSMDHDGHDSSDLLLSSNQKQVQLLQAA